MQDISMFDAMRYTGDAALTWSKEWLSDPLKTAVSFTDYVISASTYGRLDLRRRVDTPPEGDRLNQSFFTSGLIAGRWAMSGFPTVTLGHKTAAAFAATKIRSQDAVDFVRSPWPAFAIRLPNNLLFIEEDGLIREASLLIATEMEAAALSTLPLISDQNQSPNRRWFYMLMASSPLQTADRLPSATQRIDQFSAQGFFYGMRVWGFNEPIEYFASAADGGMNSTEAVRWDTHVPVDIDKRSDQLARALIVATCIHMSGDPRERAERESQDGIRITERKSKRRDGDELPQYTSFEIHSSIKINLHHAMREYVERGGSSPTVQTMVAGHWKRVPFGPGRAQRRLQHIHPYWRGDLTAPISTRIK